MAGKRKKSEWVEAGFVSIGSGEILLADPVFATSEAGYAAIDRFFDSTVYRNFDRIRGKVKMKDGREAEYQGVMMKTGYGDGLYRVWARINEDGRVAELRISFEEAWGHEKEGEEDHDIPVREIVRKLDERESEK